MTGPEFPYLSVYQAEASIDFQVFKKLKLKEIIDNNFNEPFKHRI